MCNREWEGGSLSCEEKLSIQTAQTIEACLLSVIAIHIVIMVIISGCCIPLIDCWNDHFADMEIWSNGEGQRDGKKCQGSDPCSTR